MGKCYKKEMENLIEKYRYLCFRTEHHDVGRRTKNRDPITYLYQDHGLFSKQIRFGFV